MLPDRDLQLLTAYVDGEHSQRQRKLVVRLLHKSPAARRILKELQEQARQLKLLPAHKLDSGFAGEVVAAIRRQTYAAPPVPRIASQRGRPWVLRFAVAASILSLVSGGVVWLVNRPVHPGVGSPLIAKKPDLEPRTPHVDHGPLVAKLVEGGFREFAQPLPPERPGAKFAFDELAKTQWQEHLLDEMVGKHRAVHIDVAVVNQRQAVQRLETVLQNKGIKVVVDAPAQAKLTKNQAKTEYVIYAENVRPDELAAMLYELGTDERARTSIESLTVSNVTEQDQKQLCGLLGIAAAELQAPPHQPIPLNQFIPKEDTKGSGAESSKAADRPSVGSNPRVAVVMVNEARGNGLSSQLQYFVSQRRQLHPQALQVIVVVHQA